MWPSGRDIEIGGGLHLHTVEEGSGPLVVFCHGFPELGYSWRHQLEPLVDAGYRVAIPDMLGFGVELPARRDRGLLGRQHRRRPARRSSTRSASPRPSFVGHDWGAGAVWHIARAHPERVRAVVGMSVPFAPPAPAEPTKIFRRRLGEGFYILWFQEPGVADAALMVDVRRTLTTPHVWTADWAARRRAAAAAALSDRGRARRVRRHVHAHRVHRRAQLLPQHRPQLGGRGRARRSQDHGPGDVPDRQQGSRSASSCRPSGCASGCPTCAPSM